MIRRIPDPRREDGQIVVLMMLGMVSMVVLVVWLMNTGNLLARKIEVQNAADAHAITQASWTARSLNVMSMNQTGMTQALSVNVVGLALTQTLTEATAILLDLIYDACVTVPYPANLITCPAANLAYLPAYISLINISARDPLGAGGRYRRVARALSAMNDHIVDEFPRFSGRVSSALAVENAVDGPVFYPAERSTARVGRGSVLPVEMVGDINLAIFGRVGDTRPYGGVIQGVLPIDLPRHRLCELAEDPSGSRRYENLEHYGSEGPYTRVRDAIGGRTDLLIALNTAWVTVISRMPASLRREYVLPDRADPHQSDDSAFISRLEENRTWPIRQSWKGRFLGLEPGYCNTRSTAQWIIWPFTRGATFHPYIIRHAMAGFGGLVPAQLSLYRVKQRPKHAGTLPQDSRDAMSLLAFTKRTGGPALSLDRFETPHPEIYAYAQAEVYNISTRTSRLFTKLAGYDLFTQGWRARLVPASLVEREARGVQRAVRTYGRMNQILTRLRRDVARINDH